MRVEWWFVSAEGKLIGHDVMTVKHKRRVPAQIKEVIKELRQRQSPYTQWHIYVFPNGRTLVAHNSCGIKVYQRFDVAVTALMLRGVVCEIAPVPAKFTAHLVTPSQTEGD